MGPMDLIASWAALVTIQEFEMAAGHARCCPLVAQRSLLVAATGLLVLALLRTVEIP